VRAGLVREFTGVSDPYEAPDNPELAIGTSNVGVDEAVLRIMLKLERMGICVQLIV
jgi:sulfate adenylyltransferase